MTQDDLIKLAKAAGFLIDGDSWIHAGAVLVDGRKSIDKQLKNFAALVASAERDKLQSAAECCRMCERKGVFYEKATGDEANSPKVLGEG